MFFGAFLFRKAKIQKAIKQERWEKMDYQMFKEQLAALLRRKAGDDFEVKVESVQKLNGIEKEAFVISRKKDWIAPTIYVELLYECCLQGVPLSQIAEKVLEQYRKVEAEARRPEKAAFFTNWKNAAPQIYCELIHAEKNRTLLSEVPHRKFLDLAVVYYYQMRGNRVPDATILIHETHRELWGISAEELDARAWENTLRDLPVRTDSLMVYLKEEYGVTFPLFELGPLAEQFYLVSNRRGKLGAICMCYPGVLESLSQRFEASLYVIPSSIYECMVIPDYDVFPEECLSDMVRDVNEKTVKPQEILSDHVYYYHRESGELTLCEEET